MRKCYLFQVLGLILVVISLNAVPGWANSAGLPAISGMSLIQGKSFLVVCDTKADQSGDRAGVITVRDTGGYDYQLLQVDWPERPSNDLESACPVPGRAGEFLVAESGAWTDLETQEQHPGRIFRLLVTNNNGNWTAEVVGTLEIAENLHEIEGIVCVKPPAPEEEQDYRGMPYGIPPIFELPLAPPEAEATPAVVESEQAPSKSEPDYLLIVMGTRGGTLPYEPGKLWSGYADLDAGVWKPGEPTVQALQETPWNNQKWPWARGITDLYLDQNGVIWISSAVDLGDQGPFWSIIFRDSSLDLTSSYQPVDYYGYSDTWVVQGVKIEAIAAPVIEGSVLSYATDDEAYGGVWRPLGAFPDSRY